MHTKKGQSDLLYEIKIAHRKKWAQKAFSSQQGIRDHRMLV